MNIYYTIFIVSSFVWFLPLFKQWKTKYFPYFLILSVSDPLGLFLYSYLHFSTLKYSIIMLAVKLALLQKEKHIIIYLTLGVGAAIIAISVFHERVSIYICNSLYELAIISTLFLSFYKYLLKQNVNIFLMSLIAYNIISLVKYLALALSYEQGAISFILGYSFQILFGLLFAFININIKNFKLNLTYIEKRAE